MTAASSETGKAVEVSYRVNGATGSETPIVFIHGVGDNLRSWDAVIAHLPSDRRLVRYDLRGHGNSPAPAGPWSIDDFVTDHLRLLERLAIAHADTVGFSLGGLITQRIAATHPEVVRNLVVIGAVTGRSEAERAAVAQRLELVLRHGPVIVAKKSVERWYSKGYLESHPDATARTIARMESLDPVAYANAYQVLATTDLVDDLPGIEAPTLAMTGQFDVGSPPRMSQLMAGRVANGRLRILSGARHSVLQECPELIAKEIAEHVT